MIDLQVSREEQTPEGVVSLDAVIGVQPDGSPLLARHLLAELDIAAVYIGGSFDYARIALNMPTCTPEQVRADLVATRIQHEDSTRERQRYLIREVDKCGIHVAAPSHICGPICPPCESCATRPRMRLNDCGELIEVKP